MVRERIDGRFCTCRKGAVTYYARKSLKEPIGRIELKSSICRLPGKRIEELSSSGSPLTQSEIEQEVPKKVTMHSLRSSAFLSVPFPIPSSICNAKTITSILPTKRSPMSADIRHQDDVESREDADKVMRVCFPAIWVVAHVFLMIGVRHKWFFIK